MNIRLAAVAAAITGLLATAAPASAAVGAGAFDARNPEDVLKVLSTNGASGEMMKEDNGKPFISAKAGKLSFDVHFFRCNDAKTLCDVVLYQIGFDSELASVEQINRWNAWTLMCPAYLTTEKHPHALVSAIVSAGSSRAEVAAHQEEWLKCLSDFDQFTDDPEAFLKAHE